MKGKGLTAAAIARYARLLRALPRDTVWKDGEEYYVLSVACARCKVYAATVCPLGLVPLCRACVPVLRSALKKQMAQWQAEDRLKPKAVRPHRDECTCIGCMTGLRLDDKVVDPKA